jgi:hypothetical protein
VTPGPAKKLRVIEVPKTMQDKAGLDEGQATLLPPLSYKDIWLSRRIIHALLSDYECMGQDESR